MTPRETALTLTPREANSIANDRVTAFRPPFVRDASAAGVLLCCVFDQARRDVDDMAGSLGEHLPNDALGDVEEPGEVHCRGRDVVIDRVVRKGLSDEDARIVDQGVDPAEPLDRLLHDPLRGLGCRDVTAHGEEIPSVGGADRAGCRDDGISRTRERLCDPGADTPRGAGDDHDLARWTARPLRRARPVADPTRRAGSSDEVDLVDHASRLPAGDADEHALVQPAEIDCGRFDAGRRAEGVFTRIDVLPAPETGQDLGVPVADYLVIARRARHHAPFAGCSGRRRAPSRPGG